VADGVTLTLGEAAGRIEPWPGAAS
jgi:hypothetical protein